MKVSLNSWWPVRKVCRRTFLAVLMVFGCFACGPGAQAQNRTTVSNLEDSGPGSLRDAIEQSARDPFTHATIDFEPELKGTILLQSTLNLCGAVSVSIEGPGAGRIALSGQKRVGIFIACNLLKGEPGADINVTISGLTLENGHDESGGGILTSARMTVRDTTFLENESSDEGGAITNWAGTLQVTDCTFSGNKAARMGGALFTNNGSVKITNSTFSGNSAPKGGAIYNFAYRFAIANSTIAGNTAAESGSGIENYLRMGATAEVKSTILADNAEANCFSDGSPGHKFTSLGYNLSTDDTCHFSNTGDLNSTPADLDPNGLDVHGGSTRTIALLPTSPAVDAIPADQFTGVDGNAVRKDQRGAPRPVGKGCEMGAYELSSTLPFASFRVSLGQTGPPYYYQVEAVFMPGIGSPRLDPRYQEVTVQVGDYTIKLPPGSFRLMEEGSERFYSYDGTRPRGNARITPLSGDRYKFTASLSGRPSVDHPVVLAIGDSSGTAFEAHGRIP